MRAAPAPGASLNPEGCTRPATAPASGNFHHNVRRISPQTAQRLARPMMCGNSAGKLLMGWAVWDHFATPYRVVRDPKHLREIFTVRILAHATPLYSFRGWSLIDLVESRVLPCQKGVCVGEPQLTSSGKQDVLR